MRIRIEDIDLEDTSGYASYLQPDRIQAAKEELLRGQRESRIVRCFRKNGKLVVYGNRYLALAARELGWPDIEGVITELD